MESAAGLARTPFLLTVSARACKCQQPPAELGRAQKYERALSKMEGYWNVYLGFFGDQVVWLDFQIVDLRDGRVCWRNGRSTQEEERTVVHQQKQGEGWRWVGRTGPVGGSPGRG